MIPQLLSIQVKRWRQKLPSIPRVNSIRTIWKHKVSMKTTIQPFTSQSLPPSIYTSFSWRLPVMEAKIQSAHNSGRSARTAGGNYSERRTAGYYSGRNSAQPSPRGSVHLGSGDQYPYLLRTELYEPYLLSSSLPWLISLFSWHSHKSISIQAALHFLAKVMPWRLPWLPLNRRVTSQVEQTNEPSSIITIHYYPMINIIIMYFYTHSN